MLEHTFYLIIITFYIYIMTFYLIFWLDYHIILTYLFIFYQGRVFIFIFIFLLAGIDFHKWPLSRKVDFLAFESRLSYHSASSPVTCQPQRILSLSDVFGRLFLCWSTNGYLLLSFMCQSVFHVYYIHHMEMSSMLSKQVRQQQYKRTHIHTL